MAKSNPMNAVTGNKRLKSTTKTTTRRKKTHKKNTNTFLYSTLIIIGILGGVLFLYHRYQVKKDINKLQNFVLNIPEGFKSVGIDVSHHQGKVPWNNWFSKSPLDTLIDFVYCKATEGSNFVDSEWNRNRETLNELGVINGAYHFLNPNTYSIPQAKHFLSYWKKRDIDLPPVLDVEQEGPTDKILIDNIYDWLEYVEKETGIKPIIYTSLNFFETKFKNEFKDYQFWIASYTYKPACINDKRIIHWQYTDQGKLPALDSKIDVNVSKIEF
jgi:lysozyme